MLSLNELLLILDKGNILPLKLDFKFISVIKPVICFLLKGTVIDWPIKIDFIYFWGTLYVKVLNNDIGIETTYSWISRDVNEISLKLYLWEFRN